MCSSFVDACVRGFAHRDSRVRRYGYESFYSIGLVSTLLATGDLGMLREFMAHSIAGAALNDKAMLAGMEPTLKTFGWRTEDGHCAWTLDTFLLILRGLNALLEEDTDTSRAALREWLPPPAVLAVNFAADGALAL